jgi:glutamine synthetase
LSLFNTSKNVELFKRQGIYLPEEIQAREHILLEEYCKTIKIESLTMLDMLNREIIPATFKYEKALTQIVMNKKSLKLDTSVELKTLKSISSLLNDIDSTKNKLLSSLVSVRDIVD